MAYAQRIQEFYMPRDGEDQKRLIKQAIDEWLDKKFAEFGKRSLRALSAAAFASLVYWILTTHGWKHLGTN